MIFADTGAFVALYCINDQHHGEALLTWPRIGAKVFTSNFVIGEVGNLLGQRLGAIPASDRLSDIFTSTSIEVIRATREDEVRALDYMRKFSDQSVSFIDGTSFSIMRRHRIKTAFTFDRHFRLAGFEIIGLK